MKRKCRKQINIKEKKMRINVRRERAKTFSSQGRVHKHLFRTPPTPESSEFSATVEGFHLNIFPFFRRNKYHRPKGIDKSVLPFVLILDKERKSNSKIVALSKKGTRDS